MSDTTIPHNQAAGLSEVERVVDVFLSPAKTFTDIRRSASWWLPFLLAVLSTLGTALVVDKQVGFERVAENQIHQNQKQEEAMNSLTAEQRAQRLQGMGKAYRYSTYCSFVFILIFVAIGALLYWASFNFVMGAHTTFKQMFAVWMYASLPRLLIALLSIVMLLAGVNTDSYNLQNPVGTNLAYYMPEAAPWLRTILSFFDVIGLWVLALLVIGTAIVAKVARGKAAIIVLGWWLLGMIVMTGIAAASS